MKDTLIGRFVAQYEEAASGCMMDAETAETLAREFKNMADKIERLEQALEDIFLDDGGFLAGDPARCKGITWQRVDSRRV